jgi:hypothetical protein
MSEKAEACFDLPLREAVVADTEMWSSENNGDDKCSWQQSRNEILGVVVIQNLTTSS